MTNKDWICKTCGAQLVKTTSGYLTCEHGTGNLLPAPRIEDLPRAVRFDYKRWHILGREGYWEYVPHKHKEALERAPEPGCMVAKVFIRHNGRWEPRMFRPCPPPR